MSVHLRRDGRWVVKYRIPGTDKQRWEYFGRGVEGEAAARARQDALDIRPYVQRTPRRSHSAPVFGEIAEAYYENHGAALPLPSRQNLYWKLVGVLVPELGHLAVNELSAYRMDQYVARRLKAGKKRTTVHREISDVMAILNWAANRGLISRSPLAGYRKPSRDDAVIQPASSHELAKILACATEHLARAILIGFYTGVRPGRSEMFALRWSNIDWRQRTIWIRAARKHGPAARMVPLHPDLLDRLLSWHRSDVESGNPDFIVHYRGRPVTTLKTSWAAAKRRAGISRRLPLYSLRHAFATLLLAAAADLKTTSIFLGHSRPDTTMRVYQHLDAGLAARTIARLPGLTTQSVANPRAKKD